MTAPDRHIVEVQHPDGSVSRALDWLDGLEAMEDLNEKAPGTDTEGKAQGGAQL